MSYSQGSNLDIHIRSVLHNSRASKLQELVMMGHVDLSKPLIEHPDNHNTDNHLLSPQSIISNSPGVNSASKTPTPASPLTSPNPQRSLAEIFSQGTNEEQEQY